MSLSFVSAYLLRALRWLEAMRLALMQARKWLRRGCGLLSLPCYRDAWHFGRLAGQDLRCWRDSVVLSWSEFPAGCSHCGAALSAHGLCSCVEFETQQAVRGVTLCPPATFCP